MNIYLTMIIGGLMGITIHSIVSIRAINKRVDSVNVRQVINEYFKSDLPSILCSIFFFGVLLFIASEFVDLKAIDTAHSGEPISERVLHFNISNFIKTSSILAGYFSDSIIYGFLGVTEKKLKSFFDKTTPDGK